MLLFGAVYFYVLAVFNLGYFSIMFALELVSDMRPLASPEYVVAGAILVMSMALAFVEPPKVGRLEGALPIALAALTVLAVSQADYAINKATHGNYDRAPPADTPFESAVSLAGITPASIQSRNLVIVMVEAMGQPRSERTPRFPRASGTGRNGVGGSTFATARRATSARPRLLKFANFAAGTPPSKPSISPLPTACPNALQPPGSRRMRSTHLPAPSSTGCAGIQRLAFQTCAFPNA